MVVRRTRGETASRLDFSEVLPMRRSLGSFNSFLGSARYSNGTLSELANRNLTLIRKAIATPILRNALVQWIKEQEQQGTTVAQELKVLATNLSQEVFT